MGLAELVTANAAPMGVVRAKGDESKSVVQGHDGYCRRLEGGVGSSSRKLWLKYNETGGVTPEEIAELLRISLENLIRLKEDRDIAAVKGMNPYIDQTAESDVGGLISKILADERLDPKDLQEVGDEFNRRLGGKGGIMEYLGISVPVGKEKGVQDENWFFRNAKLVAVALGNIRDTLDRWIEDSDKKKGEQEAYKSLADFNDLIVALHTERLEKKQKGILDPEFADCIEAYAQETYGLTNATRLTPLEEQTLAEMVAIKNRVNGNYGHRPSNGEDNELRRDLVAVSKAAALGVWTNHGPVRIPEKFRSVYSS